MSEADTIAAANSPLTVKSFADQLATCGLGAGQTVLVHTSLSKLGWIAGGPQAVIEALLAVLAPGGTLLMPAHSNDNSEPSYWKNPPVPQAWWQIIRDERTPFDAQRTPTRGVGCVPELFRTWPGVVRSNHPTDSLAACGPNASYLVSSHTLENEFGDESPIGRLYALDGFVLLLGAGHESNTSLHLAEHRAAWAAKRHFQQGSAVLIDGLRQWVTYQALDVDVSDFPALGAAYEAEHGIAPGRVGKAESRFLKQRPLVDYAVRWIERNRK
jgi:aminoglycoside 3-N-acetyltransferase